MLANCSPEPDARLPVQGCGAFNLTNLAADPSPLTLALPPIQGSGAPLIAVTPPTGMGILV